MTWDDVLELKQNGMLIGGHTYSHAKLNQITDSKDLDYEIADSKNDMENHLGESIEYFAYPYGLYNKKVIDKVKKSGYKAALADTAGTDNIVHRLYALNRHNMGNNFEIFKKTLPSISIATSTKLK